MFLGHFFLLCPFSTTFPPSKANHNPCTTFTGHFFYFFHPLQPSLHRKPIMTHVQHSLAIFSTLSILNNLPSIESTSLPTYNVPRPFFCFAHTDILHKHSSICPSKANYDPCTTIFGSTDSTPCNLLSVYFPAHCTV